MARAGNCQAPGPVLGTDNRRNLVHEMSLHQCDPLKERVDRIQVLDAGSGSVVASYAGPAAVRGAHEAGRGHLDRYGRAGA